MEFDRQLKPMKFPFGGHSYFQTVCPQDGFTLHQGTHSGPQWTTVDPNMGAIM